MVGAAPVALATEVRMTESQTPVYTGAAPFADSRELRRKTFPGT
jgi:hypothetical protein